MQAWVWIVVAVAGLGGLILGAGYLLPKLIRLFRAANSLFGLFHIIESVNLDSAAPKRPNSQLEDDPATHRQQRAALLRTKRKLKQARERRLVARVLKR